MTLIEFGQHDAHRNPAMIFAPTPPEGSIVDTLVTGVKQFLGFKVK